MVAKKELKFTQLELDEAFMKGKQMILDTRAFNVGDLQQKYQAGYDNGVKEGIRRTLKKYDRFIFHLADSDDYTYRTGKEWAKRASDMLEENLQ